MKRIDFLIRFAKTTAAFAALASVIVLAVLMHDWNERRTREAAPGDLWFDAESVHVYDTWEGDAPYLHVKRVIRQSFIGEFLTVVRQHPGGAQACPAVWRPGAYTAGARLPPDLTLDWWMQDRCRLQPGRYVLDTHWRWTPPGFPPKAEYIRSNVFEIHRR